MSIRFARLSAFGFIFTGMALLLTGCQGLAKIPASSTSTQTTGTVAAIRSYNGTASVGDFVTISIDSTASTISYHDISNGEAGTVSYAVDADGTYSINDPQGNVLSAYEVPGFVMLVEAAKAGPNQNTPALITAVESTPANILSFAGQNFNYLQFRTAAGGIEIGSVSVDSQGNIQHNSYSPMALIWGNGQYFDSGNFAASSITEDPSGNYFTINEQDSSKDVVFGTQNGLWAVDTGIGTILGLPKANSKNFQAGSAGTYKGIYYEKANAETGGNNFEIGSATQGTSAAVVAADGTITITDAQNNILATGTLVPVADAAYLYDGTVNTLSDPCNGLFTVRIATSTLQQDLFVAFQGNAVIFGSFQSALPGQNSNPYTYFYGVGLK
jgi:hypothetical protein